TLSGAVDGAAFARALGWVMDRHEVLRTLLCEENAGASQRIVQEYTLPLQEVDLRALPEPERTVRYRELVRRESERRFALERELPLRVWLVHREAGAARVLVVQHHIATDAWSMQVLERELRTAYAAFAAGRMPPLPALQWHYADYASWQRTWLQGEMLAGDLDYWQTQLSGLPRLHGLPLDGVRPGQQRFAGRVYRQMVPAELAGGVKALAAQQEMTVFMVLQTAFAIVLGRHSGERDIVMGSPISGRVHRELEGMLGFFVNTLVLRTALLPERTVQAQLVANRQMVLEAFNHQHVPFEYLVEVLKPERSMSHAPLFQILFNVLDAEE